MGDQMVSRPEAALCDLIGSIGEADFPRELVHCLHHMVGAEHCAVIGIDSGTPFKVAAASLDGTDLAERQIDIYLKSYWRMDPTMLTVTASGRDDASHLVRLDPDRLPPSALRDIVYRRGQVSERLLMWDATDTPISISIVRSVRAGKFTSGDMAHLEAMSHLMLSIVRKHCALVQRRSDFCATIGSLSQIMQCVNAESGDLSRREAEVCARILYGQSTRLIAAELAIGDETVKTYRRRAYERLGISTQRELLSWFANRWSGTGRQLH